MKLYKCTIRFKEAETPLYIQHVEAVSIGSALGTFAITLQRLPTIQDAVIVEIVPCSE